MGKKRTQCGAVIVAAGNATRMRGIDKILEPVGGIPMIVRTAAVFQQCDAISQIVIVTRRELTEAVAELCMQAGIAKLQSVAPGGQTRAASVRIGLRLLPDACGFAAVHDGARPLVTQELIERVVLRAQKTYAAAPAVAVKDTIKYAKNGIVEKTPDRRLLFAVQTPQVFDRELLCAGLQAAEERGLPLTDDCSAVEALGKQVYLVEGSEENIKITTPEDLIFANMILERRKNDAHRSRV